MASPRAEDARGVRPVLKGRAFRPPVALLDPARPIGPRRAKVTSSWSGRGPRSCQAAQPGSYRAGQAARPRCAARGDPGRRGRFAAVRGCSKGLVAQPSPRSVLHAGMPAAGTRYGPGPVSPICGPACSSTKQWGRHRADRNRVGARTDAASLSRKRVSVARGGGDDGEVARVPGFPHGRTAIRAAVDPCLGGRSHLRSGGPTARTEAHLQVGLDDPGRTGGSWR